MPTYEYLCQACSHRFETWQKMADEPLTICPECGGHIRRVLYATGVIFKGSGFYKTDYNKNGALPPTDGDAGKAVESAKSDTKTSESTSGEQGTSEAKATTSSETKAARAAAS